MPLGAIPLSALTKLGIGLQRPEDVVISATPSCTHPLAGNPHLSGGRYVRAGAGSDAEWMMARPGGTRHRAVRPG